MGDGHRRPIRAALLTALAGGWMAGCASPQGGEATAAVLDLPDCSRADTADLSPLAVDAFQRELAIDTPAQVERRLDADPLLICQELESDRHGTVSPIAYAAGHRPDGQMLFDLLVERGARLDDALPVAAYRGDTPMVEWLLERGADPDAGQAIVRAAKMRRTRVVEALLQAGADPDVTIEGNASLHHAARAQSTEMIQALLSSGAEIDPVNNNDRTPFAIAVDHEHIGTLQQLYAGGADPHRLSRADMRTLRGLSQRWGLGEILHYLD